MPRRMLVALIIVFVATRGAMAWVSLTPERYSVAGIVPASDVSLYEGWSVAVIHDHKTVYSEVPIEYPPGSLPFILLPEEVRQSHTYLEAFVAMSVIIDVLGLVALLLLARRWRSSWGPWLWVVGVALLGPVVYLRLDLVPAVATIWAVERASTRDWISSGGWFGLAAIAKLYAFLFLPLGFFTAHRRLAFSLAAIGVVGVILLPLTPQMGSVVHDVLGYHTARGIQVESTWGGILFVAQRLGTDAPVGYSYGALHFAGHLADVLKPVSSIASLVALVVVTAVVWRRRREQSATLLAESTFVLLALELALGSVFSPQYLVWLIALGAAVACINGTKLRNATLFLLPAAVLTQLLFPFLYNELLVATTKPVAILWIRNLTILGIGLWGLWKLWVGRVSDPSTEGLASR